jgi:putative ATP-dependent endonuclease of OLD family
VGIDFDMITIFIGPTGIGRSAVLPALDWFFNGTAQPLAKADVWAGSEHKQVSVEV